MPEIAAARMMQFSASPTTAGAPLAPAPRRRLLRALPAVLPALAALGLAACASAPRAADSSPALPRPETGGVTRAAATPPAGGEFWDELANADVIYIGEKHDEAAHHEYQFAVLQGLRARGVPFAVGWEMFDVTQQPALDDWRAGRLDTDALLARTGFRASWGKSTPLYERMLRWSRGERVEAVALNAPRALSRKTARGEALTAAERRLLPPGYRALPGGMENFRRQMAGHGGASAEDFPWERYYAAQTVWDQAMAESVVQFRRRRPAMRLVVLAGRGHVEGGYGIPAYVKQKLPWVRQTILLPAEGNASPGGPVDSPVAPAPEPAAGAADPASVPAARDQSFTPPGFAPR